MYPGSSQASSTTSVTWKPADLDNPSHEIPLAELTRKDPILFYAEIPLFEDELHDNGASSLLVRIVSVSRVLIESSVDPYDSGSCRHVSSSSHVLR